MRGARVVDEVVYHKDSPFQVRMRQPGIPQQSRFARGRTAEFVESTVDGEVPRELGQRHGDLCGSDAAVCSSFAESRLEGEGREAVRIQLALLLRGRLAIEPWRGWVRRATGRRGPGWLAGLPVADFVKEHIGEQERRLDGQESVAGSNVRFEPGHEASRVHDDAAALLIRCYQLALAESVRSYCKDRHSIAGSWDNPAG